MAQSVLITGAGGGLGAAAASAFARRGWTVYAADLTPPAAAAGLVPVRMDVTATKSVEQAIAGLGTSELQCVVTLAGVLGVGPLAEMDDAKLQRVIDVNVMGTHRVVRAAFPLLSAGNGRIILISSETGWQPAMPFNGAYALSKHAVEAYGDALRRELAPLGVPVSIIQPGPFRTGMTASIEAAFADATIDGSPFAERVRKAGRLAAAQHEKAHDPGVLAAVIVEAATKSTPKLRYSVRPDRARALASRLPVRVVDSILRRAL
ncbi:SDR family NAD(P)-dependent oxidoreductase [Hoyosella sp. YIM 151337]|uniref:SDR family NAD(P)-dependent oxidoreductase n=1 Tax=Hoyosella sp. YIM 151337 TaxID=2992742 RepID=UPI00223653AD|nr:SDR family NAD(P)-dependent oxidoreductase [Hoyosella sp. YIM 151337]MCW4353362.1 SDR family NAD(P)-dependent oxidoreductase [Hoyosella sp. YIM 151337]